MNHPPHSLLALLTHHMEEIIQRWVHAQSDTTLAPGFEGEKETQARLTLLDELVRVLGEGAHMARTDSEFVSLLSQLSEQRARQGFTPQQTMHFLLDLRPAVLPILLREVPPDPPRLLALLVELCTLVDELTLETFEIHLRNRMGTLPLLPDSPADEVSLLEPWPGLYALPLDEGWIDGPGWATALLEAVRSRGVRVMLLDFTEVSQLDGESGRQWVQTIRALRLLGATPLLMGLSAPVAQALAQAGLEPG